jgi:hypothetical protein
MAIIRYDNFTSVGALAEYLEQVHKSAELQEKHLSWTRREFSPEFSRVIARSRSRENVLCTLCNRVRREQDEVRGSPLIAEPYPKCTIK